MARHPNSYDEEDALTRAFYRIDEQISELQRDKQSIERQLKIIRERNIDLKDVTRKNSFARIIAEKTIFDILSSQKRPIRSEQLYNELKVRINSMKPTTFRSHIKRMGDKKSIHSPKRGYWMVPKDVKHSIKSI